MNDEGLAERTAANPFVYLDFTQESPRWAACVEPVGTTSPTRRPLLLSYSEELPRWRADMGPYRKSRFNALARSEGGDRRGSDPNGEQRACRPATRPTGSAPRRAASPAHHRDVRRES